jgi:rhomboid protease GluP
VTLLLIAANIIAAFFILLRPDQIDVYGFSPASPSLLPFITSLFVHANAIHLMGNMVFLAAVGVAVEIATGSTRFSVVYFLSGLVGILLFWISVRNLGNVPPLVGASGAIAGCATYFSLRYTKLRVPLAPKASATVAWITIFWLLLQIAGAIVRIGEPIHASGFVAHLGGAITGIVLGLFFKAPDLGSRKLGHQVYEALNDQGPAAQIEHLKLHLKDHPDDLEMQLRLGEEYAEMGDHKEESETLLAIVFKLSDEQLEATVIRLFELKKIETLPSLRRRQLSDKLSPKLGVRLLKTVVSGDTKDAQRPEALVDIMGMSEPESPDFIEARNTLLKEYASHPLVEIVKQKGWLS